LWYLEKDAGSKYCPVTISPNPIESKQHKVGLVVSRH
jgi:hypothetical protein